MASRRAGLALIVVIGILGVLAVLAVAFVAMAQLERRASEQRINAARAYLLARSGIEDALARLALGQEPAYGGEDWNADGQLNGQEVANEVTHRGTLDVDACPVRHAMRPSWFAADNAGNPVLLPADGRKRGYSGMLSGDYAPEGNAYALKVSSSNAGIYINGGALDAEDRDPDGPGAEREDFPLNPNAAAEVAPLLPNKIPDYRDTSMEGPNGFLVRLLNNLDAIVTEEATSNLGVQVVGARPVGGYKALDELEPVLGQARYDRFKPYLTLHAWVDPKVVKPQPMDGRPQRWEDIDDAHRIGAEAKEISGIHYDTQQYNGTVSGPLLCLNPGITGDGTQAQPWTQTITVTNRSEGIYNRYKGRPEPTTYPVRWERNAVYTWSQLRLALPAFESRAPVSLNTASGRILSSVFLGLKGTTLEVWDGSAGWDAGFGWCSSGYGYNGTSVAAPYLYPSEAAEDTPWHRTRVDYGMTYGSPNRPWYGPTAYDPHGPSDSLALLGKGGRPVVQAAPLGRLKETGPISESQALAIAEQSRQCVSAAGSFRTWQSFNAFVVRLPLWEDLNDDGILDGAPYAVDGSGGTYTRRMYKREDINSDGVMTRATFTPASGSWKTGNIAWQDSGLAADPPQRKADLAAGNVPGLTFLQMDVLKAMANPNTDLNDFNPDANLWKEVDKTDLCGIQAAPESHVHTTEFSLDDQVGFSRLIVEGRVLAADGRLLARRPLAALLRLGEVHRDTTQADFMRGWGSGQRDLSQVITPTYAPPQLSPTPYPLTGSAIMPNASGPPTLGLKQGLVSYPEPQTVSAGLTALSVQRAANATYDGQISLGFIGPSLDLNIGTLQGDLFDTTEALGMADLAVPDLKGPYHEPLLTTISQRGGNVLPDGVYSEKDRTLRYPIAGNIPDGASFYLSCWVKVNWYPEASPRPHTLASLSRATSPEAEGVGLEDSYGVISGRVPVDDILMCPVGLYFVPARNNFWQSTVGTYVHDPSSTRGKGWPARALLWGRPHSLWASDTVNRRGIYTHEGSWMPIESPSPITQRPVGRLEAHRWQHVAVVHQFGQAASITILGSPLYLGRPLASQTGGGLAYALPVVWDKAIGLNHYPDQTPNHIRFGEMASAHNMNYVADATFANVRAGPVVAAQGYSLLANLLNGTPSMLGRYYKENVAVYSSPLLPAGMRPLQATWTEIPCDLWFDEEVFPGWTVPDGWPDTLANDQFGADGSKGSNGKRDVHIALEIWDDLSTDYRDDDVLLARFDDPAAPNRIPQPQGRLYYKAIFVNEWDAATRANHPLDVTPFLDDVTLLYMGPAGPTVLAWEDTSGDE